uniref:Uncharacterized protein n=1 Tax=Candidatus Kentrum sp. TC TaxID=2126339 RepID=A0A450YJX6_9GAMM|nr:MAG: hypothetical protein BECKTC1821D_GA0114238_101113 [Candidatus Kentron sp. TC]
MSFAHMEHMIGATGHNPAFSNREAMETPSPACAVNSRSGISSEIAPCWKGATISLSVSRVKADLDQGGRKQSVDWGG